MIWPPDTYITIVDCVLSGLAGYAIGLGRRHKRARHFGQSIDNESPTSPRPAAPGSHAVPGLSIDDQIGAMRRASLYDHDGEGYFDPRDPLRGDRR